MNPKESVQEEIAAADAALDAGRFRLASRHIAAAERGGGWSSEIGRLQKRLADIEEQHDRQASQGVWQGFAAGAIGYLLLGMQEPPEWTMPVWGVCAFLLIPGLVGFVVGRKHSLDDFPKARFLKAFGIASMVMFVYASIAMMIAHSRVGSGSDAGQELLAGLLTATVSAAAAGGVAGAACALPAWRTQKGEAR